MLTHLAEGWFIELRLNSKMSVIVRGAVCGCGVVEVFRLGKEAEKKLRGKRWVAFGGWLKWGLSEKHR